MSGILVRRAGPDDVGAMARIQAAAPEASQWKPESYLDYECLVAEVSGEVAGFVVWRRLGGEEHEILNLATDPALRRRGVAKLLIGKALSTGVGRYYLEVRESNKAARRLYRSLGFREVGERPDYYSDPYESAIEMAFQSC